MIVEIQKLHLDAIMPTQGHADDAGWDLHALEGQVADGGDWLHVKTGIAVAIPAGFYGRIVHRSSTWRSKGLLVLEGTIDCGFRGELFVTVMNPSNVPYYVTRGDRLGQLIICPVERVAWAPVGQLPGSTRGDGGFGSTGV